MGGEEAKNPVDPRRDPQGSAHESRFDPSVCLKMGTHVIPCSRVNHHLYHFPLWKWHFGSLLEYPGFRHIDYIYIYVWMFLMFSRATGLWSIAIAADCPAMNAGLSPTTVPVHWPAAEVCVTVHCICPPVPCHGVLRHLPPMWREAMRQGHWWFNLLKDMFLWNRSRETQRTTM